jgi:hypothetical protein
VFLKTHAPLRLSATLSTAGHCDQSRFAMCVPSFHRSLLPLSNWREFDGQVEASNGSTYPRGDKAPPWASGRRGLVKSASVQSRCLWAVVGDIFPNFGYAPSREWMKVKALPCGHRLFNSSFSRL